MPELLAPAGTPAKLKTALHFGADAVYLGLKRYSMRSFAGNFDFDELEWGLGYAHERDRRVYVCLNIQPFDADFEGIESSLRTLKQLGPDALILADPGVAAMAREIAPEIPVHLSTQSSVTNAATARFWFSQGIQRIILARELHVEQLAELASTTEGDLETFVHGAICIAYSGRCLLSLYWAKRDSRRGACAQGCRWAYKEIEDSRRPGQANRVEEDERGTYFFDSKDLCALPLLDRLIATGVVSLKIEGRTRSVHYVGATVDVYRHALDRLSEGDTRGFEADKQRYLDELSRPGGRGFSTHFLTGAENDSESYLPRGHFPHGRYEYVGEVLQGNSTGLVAHIRNPIRPGCSLEIRDRGMSCEAVRMDVLRNRDGCRLDIARTGDEILLPGRFMAGPGAIVRLSREESAADGC